MSPLGIVGDGIEGYGCPPMDPLSAGLIHMEINRGDGSLGTFMAVQAGLAMKAIAKCGSEEQKGALAGTDGPAGEDRRVRADRA
jgi:alkylation response protein AidB-like acyl-CoA dehydrogenase